MKADKCISFVDRDMFMRYRGGGVGHKYMRAIEQWLWETGWGGKVPNAEESEPDTAEEEPIPAPDKGGSDSGTGSDSDDPPESEKGISGDEILEDEETLEGGFGYSVF
jgi:hypothetical protein